MKSKKDIQKEYNKRTHYQAQKKYDKNNTKVVPIRFILSTEGDLLEKLDSVSNKSGYIKMLIRNDNDIIKNFQK